MPKRFAPRRKVSRFKKRRRFGGKGRSKVSGRKKWGKGKASTAIIKQPSGAPDRLFVKLKYCEYLTWNQMSGAVSVAIYRGNSIYDPVVALGGGQPYFFDQWAAIYNNYRVHGCKAKVNSSGNGGGGFNACMTGITFSNSSTSLGTSAQALYQEQPYTRKSYLKMGAAAVGQNAMTSYMSTRKILGLSKIQVEDQNFQATVNTDPATQWYIHVWSFTPDSNQLAMNSWVELTYYVEFCNRAIPAI